MATAKLTLIGLYNYDSTLFEGLQLPEYFDKETLVNTILLAGGEFGTLYPDADFMKQAINLWSAKNQRYFERLATLMQEDYSPLENYNRREEWHDEGTGSNSDEFNTRSAGTNTNTTTGTDNNTTENQVSAYNSSAYEPRDKSISSGSDTTTSNGSTTLSDGGTSKSNNQYETDRSGFARGNIGVMSSQDMFRQELTVIGISPYEVIAGDFINEFCIKLYV